MLEISVKKKPKSTIAFDSESLMINPVVNNIKDKDKYKNRSFLLNFLRIISRVNINTIKTRIITVN